MFMSVYEGNLFYRVLKTNVKGKDEPDWNEFVPQQRVFSASR